MDEITFGTRLFAFGMVCGAMAYYCLGDWVNRVVRSVATRLDRKAELERIHSSLNHLSAQLGELRHLDTLTTLSEKIDALTYPVAQPQEPKSRKRAKKTTPATAINGAAPSSNS